MKPKLKQKNEESQKLKAVISKTVNKQIEEEMRHRAYDGQVNFSKAQDAVSKHHKKQTEEQQSSSTATIN